MKTGIDKYTFFFFFKLSNENSRLDVPIDEVVIFSVHKFNIVMCYFINFFSPNLDTGVLDLLVNTLI